MYTPCLLNRIKQGMDIPAVRVLLEQEKCSLKDHTRDFLDPARLTHSLTHLLKSAFFTTPASISSPRLACP